LSHHTFAFFSVPLSCCPSSFRLGLQDVIVDSIVSRFGSLRRSVVAPPLEATPPLGRRQSLAVWLATRLVERSFGTLVTPLTFPRRSSSL